MISHKMQKDLEILNQILLGRFISRFSIGDTYDIFIEEYCLSAHTINLEGEKAINDYLKGNLKAYGATVDRDDSAKSAILSANMRKEITQISLDDMKNLTLEFKEGSRLTVCTDTEFVDWQWCINKTGNSPYIDHEIACFWAGKTEIAETRS